MVTTQGIWICPELFLELRKVALFPFKSTTLWPFHMFPVSVGTKKTEKKPRSSGAHFNRFLNSDLWAAACWATMSLPWLSRNLSLAGFLVTLQHFLFPSTGSTAKEQSFGCPRPSTSFRIRKCYHAHQLEKESKEMSLSTQWFWVKGHTHTLKNNPDAYIIPYTQQRLDFTYTMHISNTSYIHT